AGLALPEDRLAEEVDVEAEAVAAGAGEVLGERGVVGVDDEVADELAQAPARERDDEPRGERGDERARTEERAVDRPEEAGGTGGDARQLPGGDLLVLGAGDAVDEGDREVQALRVTDQGGELAGGGPLPARLPLLGGREPRLGEGDRVLHEVGHVRRGGRALVGGGRGRHDACSGIARCKSLSVLPGSHDPPTRGTRPTPLAPTAVSSPRGSAQAAHLTPADSGIPPARLSAGRPPHSRRQRDPAHPAQRRPTRKETTAARTTVLKVQPTSM